jgi:hypothetical protein
MLSGRSAATYKYELAGSVTPLREAISLYDTSLWDMKIYTQGV